MYLPEDEALEEILKLLESVPPSQKKMTLLSL